MDDPVDQLRKTERIRELNDAFRTTFEGGQVFITSGVQNIHGTIAVLEKVRKFSDFTEENDPHGEHDFGAFEFRDAKFFLEDRLL